MSGITKEVVENNTEHDTEHIYFGVPFALFQKGCSINKKEKGNKVE